MKTHLYLTGYRGTGKTSVGVLLAKALNRPIIDSDQVVSANTGKSIREIFGVGGEAMFRDLETEALQTVSQAEASIISLGGGAVIRDENRKIIQATGECYWLDADPETIAARLQGDAATAEQRPALTSLPGLAEIRELMTQRRELYHSVADHRIDTSGKSIAEVAQAILEIFKSPSEATDK
ncbi:MAG: shikimate kinase [Rubripirellula sp.]